MGKLLGLCAVLALGASAHSLDSEALVQTSVQRIAQMREVPVVRHKKQSSLTGDSLSEEEEEFMRETFEEEQAEEEEQFMRETFEEELETGPQDFAEEEAEAGLTHPEAPSGDASEEAGMAEIFVPEDSLGAGDVKIPQNNSLPSNVEIPKPRKKRVPLVFPTYPTKPGCYFWLPEGCQRNGSTKIVSNERNWRVLPKTAMPSWKKDEVYQGYRLGRQHCLYHRRGHYNAYCKIKNAKMLFVAEPPAPPENDGCFVFMPSGCPKQGMMESSRLATWVEDHAGISSRTDCVSRKPLYDAWCGMNNAKMLFHVNDTRVAQELLEKQRSKDLYYTPVVPPETPGCYIWLPHGCPKQGDLPQYNTWFEDLKGKAGRRACMARKSEFDEWCGQAKTRVAFVQNETAIAEENAKRETFIEMRYGEKRPQGPGCHVWMPSGCRALGAAKSRAFQKWREDVTGSDSQTHCHSRKADYDRYCGVDDAEMVYVYIPGWSPEKQAMRAPLPDRPRPQRAARPSSQLLGSKITDEEEEFLRGAFSAEDEEETTGQTMEEDMIMGQTFEEDIMRETFEEESSEESEAISSSAPEVAVRHSLDHSKMSQNDYGRKGSLLGSTVAVQKEEEDFLRHAFPQDSETEAMSGSAPEKTEIPNDSHPKESEPEAPSGSAPEEAVASILTQEEEEAEALLPPTDDLYLEEQEVPQDSSPEEPESEARGGDAPEEARMAEIYAPEDRRPKDMELNMKSIEQDFEEYEELQEEADVPSEESLPPVE